MVPQMQPCREVSGTLRRQSHELLKGYWRKWKNSSLSEIEIGSDSNPKVIVIKNGGVLEIGQVEMPALPFVQ